MSGGASLAAGARPRPRLRSNFVNFPFGNFQHPGVER